jgi:hypothetical protein
MPALQTLVRLARERREAEATAARSWLHGVLAAGPGTSAAAAAVEEEADGAAAAIPGARRAVGGAAAPRGPARQGFTAHGMAPITLVSE